MNKSFYVLALLLVTAFSGVQAQKIAYINSSVLMADVPEVKSADSNLQAFQAQMQKKGEQMVTTLQAKYQELGKRQQSGDISPKDLETQSAALKAEEQKIAEFEQDMNKQVADKRQALYQPILDKLNKLINDVAKEKGYSFVFDSSTGVILYGDEMYDITQTVKDKLKSVSMTETKPATSGKAGGK